MLRKLKSILLLLLLLPFIVVPVMAKTMSDVPTYSENEGDQNYLTWSKPVRSYLVDKGNGFERVQYVGEDKIVATTFDKSFNPVSEKEIQLELPDFGGFYNGNNAYYVVEGQSNKAESNDVEVFRVIKYDKNWNRITSAPFYGYNTVYPFDAGSCRMTEIGNYLFVRTCHEMYTSSDGLNHQANVTIEIETSSMQPVDSFYDVMNVGMGYVSHSFNQFVLNDNGTLVCLDHGDAYPRSAVLGKYTEGNEVDGIKIGLFADYNSTPVMEYPGETGNNTTGASLGGLEASNNNYLTVGNSTNTRDINSDTRDVYVTVTPKVALDTYSDANLTKTVWLTSLGNSRTTTTPQLVKYDGSTFAVIWTEIDSGYPYGNGKTYCQFIDGEGNLKGKAQEIDATISDCKPIISNNKAVWFVDHKDADGAELISLYTLDPSDKLETADIYKPVPATDLTVDPTEVNFTLGDGESTKQLDVTVTPSNITDEVTYKSSDTNVAEVSDSGLITAKNEGSATITIIAGSISKEVKVNVVNHVEIYRLYNRESGEHLYTPALEEVRALENSGWTNEGIGWNAPRKGKPIYRLYNPVLADHLYTSDENEVNELTSSRGWVADFNREPIFYSTDSGTPIYRLYNEESKRHLLTRDANEYAQLPSHGWTQEGTSLYGLE